MSAAFEDLLRALDDGRREPLYLVSGDRVLAEPAGVRLGQRLAAQAGCEPEVHKRPAQLESLLADLRTYSLFSTAKVVVAIETAILADVEAAADLVDEAVEVLPLSGEGGDLTPRDRRAAIRLLQVLRLFQLEPFAGAAEEVVAGLPERALKGGRSRRCGRGRRGRSRSRIEALRPELARLLEAAREAGLEGRAETDLAQLAEILERGLPEGHALVLVESAVASGHPLVAALEQRGALARVGRVEAGRGGSWKGLELLADELERETGVGIEPGAREELARRTLQRREGGGRGAEEVDAESSARFAAEYRKLAMAAAGDRIASEEVAAGVRDRGEEDVWEILDAVAGRSPADALQRIRRLLGGASDPVSARLSFFALLAEMARHLTAVAGMLRVAGVPAGVRSYARFKESIAPALQAELPGGGRNPLAGLHPYRLHKAYLAASAAPPRRLEALPWRLLQTELRLKGESARPDAALAELVSELARLR